MKKSLAERFTASLLPPLIVLVVLLLVCQAVSTWLDLTSDLVLPSPITVVEKTVDYFKSGPEDVLMTIKYMTLGFFSSIPVAMIIAGLLAQSKIVIRMTHPLIVSLAMMPFCVLVCRMQIWTNYADYSRVLCVMLQTVPIITLNVLTGFTNVPSEKEELAVLYGANRAKRFFKIVVPNALPDIFEGLRLGVMNSVLGVISTEMLIITGGLGTRIIVACKYLQIPLVYGVIIVISIVGTALMSIVSLVDRRIVAWKE